MIDDLSLTITLKIIGCGESMGYLILNAEAGHLLAGEVYPQKLDTYLLAKFVQLSEIMVWESPK